MNLGHIHPLLSSINLSIPTQLSFLNKILSSFYDFFFKLPSELIRVFQMSMGVKLLTGDKKFTGISITDENDSHFSVNH